MKFLLIAFALVGTAAAVTVLDSATQGPNPQDIATPEPEYIDIDLPEAAPAPQLALAPKLFAPAPRPNQHPVQAASYFTPIVQQHFQPEFLQPQLPGHIYEQSGYQYRRPVYVRRVYRRRY